MKHRIPVVLLIVTGAAIPGCAVGSATAGYSASAGTADDLKTNARSRIVDDAVGQSKAYTDAEIAKLRAELGAAKR